MRRRFFIFCFIAASSMVYYACSYVEYFMVKNTSEEKAVVSYSLEKPRKGHPSVFDRNFMVYHLKSSGEVDWGNTIEVADEDPSENGIRITLPPRSILNFGRLSHESYENVDQEFINDKVFNLEKMKILIQDQEKVILKSEFDQHFSKKYGRITYTITQKSADKK